MVNTTQPLPENQAVLERLLEEANRIVDWLEPVYATERFQAEQIDRADEDTLQVLPMLGALRSTGEDMRRHMALGGPAPGMLVPFFNEQVVADIIRDFEPARARLNAIAQRSPVAKQEWRPAAEAIRSMMSCEAKFLDMVKELRQRIVEKLAGPAGASAKTVADKTPDKSAKKSRAKRVRLPANEDVLRLAKDVQRGVALGLSKNEIALEFTKGNKKKAANLLRQLRRHSYLIEPVAVK